ncbi:MAG TPA: 30S ribosomal protein S18 [Planctomycetota bacterium]|nr:30S ribosomal protein S18 [Planctomycetota bacterium]
MSQAKLKAKEKKKRLKKLTERGVCRFTRGLKDPAEIKKSLQQLDYKNVDLLARFLTPQGKLFSRKRSGNSQPAQQRLKVAVKYARQLALIPYVG